MNRVNLTSDQIKTTREKFLNKMLAARAVFIEANPDYMDKSLDYDDLQVIKAMVEKTGSSGDTIYNKEKLADIRAGFVASGRSTFTLDRMTVKTDEGVDESEKFVVMPWLAVKQSRTDKIMYQQPKSGSGKLNSFLDSDGAEHKVLRAKRVFQLASEDEIGNFASDIDVSLDLFLQLNF